MTYKQRISRFAVTAVLSTAVTVLPAYAQFNNANGGAVSSRLDRIERDITTLSQQVYNGKNPPSGPISYDDGSSSLAATLQVRIDAMEETIRQLNGKVEEQTYQIQQLQDQLTKIQSDTDVRLQGLENRPVGTAPSAMPQAPADSTSSLRPDETETPPAPTPQNNAQLEGGTATQMYDQAFSYIRSGDYGEAERAFTAFLAAFPQDKLSSNAEYWLGETYYVRGQYDKAASAFARGYQNHPKSTKASDNLLKLALSLGALNRKDDACLALVQLDNDFPKATQALKDRVAKEKEKLSCPQ